MDVLLFPKGRPNPRSALAESLPEEQLKILDVCCGTGCSSVAMARRHQGYSVTGVDITENMLKVARQKIKRERLEHVAFLKMNATNMDFAENEFDIATISLALHEMPEKLRDSVISEIGRVLKPGGRFHVIEWERPASGIQKHIFSFFPVLFEPKGIKKFLELNWVDLLGRFGLEFESSRHYTFTKLITAVKR